MTRAVIAAAFILGAIAAASCSSDGEETARPVVRIFGPYRGEEAALFTAGFDEWAEEAGIDVRYTGTSNFVADLRYQVEEVLSPPDIAMVPQPGLVRKLYDAGYIVPISDDIADSLERSYGDAVLDLGRMDGTLVGFPFRASPKSLVWYRPDVVAGLGFPVPITFDELESLVDQIQAKGITPWCVGIESQLATGWPATDWVEDLILRREGVEVYNDWVAGRVPFSDPRIAAAFASFRELVLEPGRVAGGVRQVLSTSTQAADDPLFADPPGCVLYKKAGVAYGWMPPDLELGPDGDVNFFVLPGTEVAAPTPIVAGGDLAVAFDDRAEVAAVLARLATAEAGRAWAKGGSYVSPCNDVDPESYYGPADQAFAELLVEAEIVVFDGSDAMPPETGTTLFWSEITGWISGRVSYDDLARALDDSRAG